MPVVMMRLTFVTMCGTPFALPTMEDDVLLIDAGECDKSVRFVETLRLQNFLIGAVCADDRRLRQHLCELFTALGVVFDDLDMDVRADKHLRKVIADAAAADEHGVADLFLRDAEALHEVGKHRDRRGDVDVVAAAQHGIAGRNECVAVTDDGADEHLAAQHVRQVI